MLVARIASVRTTVNSVTGTTASLLGPRIAVVPIGHDQPATVGTLAKCERELPDVGLPLLLAKPPMI